MLAVSNADQRRGNIVLVRIKAYYPASNESLLNILKQDLMLTILRNNGNLDKEDPQQINFFSSKRLKFGFKLT